MDFAKLEDRLELIHKFRMGYINIADFESVFGVSHRAAASCLLYTGFNTKSQVGLNSSYIASLMEFSEKFLKGTIREDVELYCVAQMIADGL